MFCGIISGIPVGYIASRLQKGEGSGCLMNLVLGLIGGLVGGWLFSIHSHLISELGSRLTFSPISIW